MDYNRLHSTLIALQKLASWRWWQVAAAVILLAATTLLPSIWASIWARGGWDGTPWVALAYLLFVALDAVLLAALPRVHLSYGPVPPSLLALSVLRWLASLVAATAMLWFPQAWPLVSLIAVQVLLFGLVIYGCMVEPFRLTVARLEVEHPKLVHLPRPLKVLYLTDLHMERPTPRDERVLALAADLAPDMILLGGDYLNLSFAEEDAAIGHAQDWLSRLSAPLGVFAVLGTPEVDVRHCSAKLTTATGVQLLRNEVVEVGAHIAVVGVTCERELEVDGAGLEAALADVSANRFTILIYHMPDLMPKAAEKRIDLYLAGHTHGGQWRLPGYGAVITSSAYGKRYEMGRYEEGGTLLYVSRGLGMEGLAAPRARFLCPPEAVLITLSSPSGSVTDYGKLGS